MPTYSYYHLITRIYLASRFRTHLALPPSHPESPRPFRARVIVARPRFLPPPLRLLRPIKSFISSSYFFSLGSFVRTLYIMYYQTCRLCVICTNTSYVTLDFHAIHNWCLDFPFLSVTFLFRVVFVTSAGNNAIPFFTWELPSLWLCDINWQVHLCIIRSDTFIPSNSNDTTC